MRRSISLSVRVIALVLRLQLHVVVGLVEKPEQPVYLVSGVPAELVIAQNSCSGQMSVGR